METNSNNFNIEIKNTTSKNLWVRLYKLNSNHEDKEFETCWLDPSFCKSVIHTKTLDLSTDYNMMNYCFCKPINVGEFEDYPKINYVLDSNKFDHNICVTPLFDGRISTSIKLIIIMGNQKENYEIIEGKSYRENVLKLVKRFKENEIPNENITILLNDQVTPESVQESLLNISSSSVNSDVIFIYLAGIGIIEVSEEKKDIQINKINFQKSKTKEFSLSTNEGNITSSFIFDSLKNSKASHIYFAVNSNYSGQIIEDYKNFDNKKIQSNCEFICSTKSNFNEKSSLQFVTLLYENLFNKNGFISYFKEIGKKLSSDNSNLEYGLKVQYFVSENQNQSIELYDIKKINNEEKFKYEKYSYSGEIEIEYDEEWIEISEKYQLFLSIYLNNFPHKDLILKKFPYAKICTLTEILLTYFIDFDYNNIKQVKDEPIQSSKEEGGYLPWNYDLGYYDGCIYKMYNPHMTGRLSINFSDLKFDKNDNFIGTLESLTTYGDRVINSDKTWIQGVLDKNRKIICFNENNLYRYLMKLSDDNKSIIGYYGFSCSLDVENKNEYTDLIADVILYKKDIRTDFNKCIEMKNFIHKKQYQLSCNKRQIKVNLEVKNIEIDQNKENFTLSGHLTLKWKVTIDEILKALSNDDLCNYVPIWKPPKMKFINGIEVIEYTENKVTWEKTKDNLIPTLIIDIKVVLAEKFELNNFPFDIQFLTMDLLLENEVKSDKKQDHFDEIVIVPDKNKNNYFIELPERLSSSNEWEFMKSAYTVLPNDKSNSQFNRLVISFRMKRNYISYLIKICLIMCIISLLSNGLFSLSPSDQLGDRLSYGVTLLLTDAAYILVISSSVPVLPYLTIIEKYIITNFCYISLNIILISFNQMTDYLISDEITMFVSFISWLLIHLYFIVIVIYYVIPEELAKLSETIKKTDYEYQHILDTNENSIQRENNISSFPIENEAYDELTELIDLEEKKNK